MIIGVDLGNYSVKTSEGISFLAKISEYEQFNEENKLVYNNKEIYIGEGEFSTDWKKSKKENTVPLLFSSIYKSTDEDVNQVVLSLPIQQFKRTKDELKDLVDENKIACINGRNLIIDEVEIVPEGASVYYTISKKNMDKIGTNQLIIVDIGGRTTDICVFQDKKIIDVKTIPEGMLNVYQEIINYINNQYIEEFKLEEAEDIIKHGLVWNGIKQEVSFIKPILKNYFNSIFKELQLRFNVNKGYVYLTGGGSYTFKKAFQNRLNNIILSDDPVFDNANGNRKYGERLWLNK